jgi:hypothetical protein
MNDQRAGFFLAALCSLMTLSGCATATQKIHCFDKREWESIQAEKAPCSLPELSDADVLQTVREERGQSFLDDPALGPRPYEVRSVDCHYEFEYVVMAFKGHWAGFDAIDGTSFMLVGRDRRTATMALCIPRS